MPQCRERRKPPRRGGMIDEAEVQRDRKMKRSETGPDVDGSVEIPVPTEAAERQRRRAAALRENLRRRKRQERLRATGAAQHGGGRG